MIRKLTTMKKSAHLQKRKPLRRVFHNDTRWFRTSLMVQRFIELEPQFDYKNKDVGEFFCHHPKIISGIIAEGFETKNLQGSDI